MKEKSWATVSAILSVVHSLHPVTIYYVTTFKEYLDTAEQIALQQYTAVGLEKEQQVY